MNFQVGCFPWWRQHLKYRNDLIFNANVRGSICFNFPSSLVGVGFGVIILSIRGLKFANHVQATHGSRV